MVTAGGAGGARDVRLPTYTVTIAAGALERIGEIVRTAAPAHRYAVVTDDVVGPLYAGRVAAQLGAPAASAIFTMPAGESHKTRATWARLTDEMLGAGFGRDTTVVAVGGGVVGDLAGFVAATFMRGVPYVQVPTSLLAMVDASVGGKTGVDTADGKNLVGAFHQPAAVVADISALATLPVEQLRAGLAEAIKHGVIADEAYFARVESVAGSLHSIDVASPAMLDVVARSVEIKADIVRRDEREGGIRKTLNFGHTVGHAIELACGFTLLHGEAVAMGMVYESLMAEAVGAAASGTADRVRRAVQAAGLPDAPPSTVDAEAIVSGTRGDKKARAGRAEYALPARIGAMAGAERGWSMPASEDLLRQILG